MRWLFLLVIIPSALAVASRVEVWPGDAFQDSLQALGAGDTLYFNTGTYTRADDLPLLHVLPENDGVVIMSDSISPAILDGAGYNRPVIVLQGPLGDDTVLRHLTLTGGNPVSGQWFGGGGLCMANASCTVSYCTVEDNSALMGGGIFAEGGAPSLTGMVVQNNLALVSGGGVCFYGSDALLEHSSVCWNTSEDDGGGIYAYLGDTTARNVLLHGNQAGDDGGGVMHLRGRLFMQFCTLHDNSCNDDGGGILVSSADSLALESCLVTHSQGKGGVQRKNSDESVFVSHCCVWDNEYANYVNMEDPTGSFGNISEDPLYADSLLRLSQLSSGQPLDSPCFDAGHVPAAGSPVDWFSTRTDSIPDQNTADMGYHFNPFALLWSPDPQPEPFQLGLYPCPSTGSLTIRISSIDSIAVHLAAFDLYGRLLADIGDVTCSGEVETAWTVPGGIPAGVLFIRCTGANGMAVAGTVVLR